MTRKEWIDKNLPAYVNNKAHGEMVRKIFDEEPKESK